MLNYRPQTSIFTARKPSLGQGNVFTPVCQSFCSRGERGAYSIACWDPPPGQVSPGRYTPRQVTPSAHCMLGYGQQAGGTHPTGMQSSYSVSLLLKITYQQEVNGTTEFFNYYAYLLARRHCHGYKRSK